VKEKKEELVERQRKDPFRGPGLGNAPGKKRGEKEKTKEKKDWGGSGQACRWGGG